MASQTRQDWNGIKTNVIPKEGERDDAFLSDCMAVKMFDILRSALGVFSGGLALPPIAGWWITLDVQSSREAKAAAMYVCLKTQYEVKTGDPVTKCASERVRIKNS